PPMGAAAAFVTNRTNSSYDPLNVMTPTKTMGTAVTQRYCALSILIRTVVPTHRASMPSNWLAAPNIGQIVDTLPVAKREPQLPTTRRLAPIPPGIQLTVRSGA